MSQKKVAVCTFEGRKRKIVYFTKAGKPDVDCILDVRKEDECVAKKLKTVSEVILSHKDPDINEVVEITKKDILPDIDHIELSFIIEASGLPILNFEDLPALLQNHESKEENHETRPNVVETPTNDQISAIIGMDERLGSPSTSSLGKPEKPSSTSSKISSKMDERLGSPSTSSLGKPEKPSSTSSKISSKMSEIFGDCSDDESSDSGLDPKETPSTPKRYRLKKPVPLPTLPAELQALVDSAEKRKLILTKTNSFVRFFGSHLSKLTDGQPTPKDYLAFAEYVIILYPEFSDGDGGCQSFKKQLSVHLRNRRFTARKKGIKSPVKSKISVSLTKPQIKKSSNETGKPRSDTAKLLLEFQTTKTKDMHHILCLLEETFQCRRPIIQNVSKCSDVLKEYPLFANVDVVLHEYKLLGYGVEKAEQNWTAFVEGLAKVLNDGEEILTDDQRSDRAVVDLLMKLNRKVTTKAGLACDPIISVKKVFESLNNLATDLDSSPRLVVFFDGEEVATSVVVAGENLSYELSGENLVKSVSMLMACYYAFDMKFPKAYENFMIVVDVKGFGAPTPKHCSTTVNKLFRQWKSLVD